MDKLDTITEVIRLFNALAGMAAVLLTARRVGLVWPTATPSAKATVVSIMLYASATAEFSLEAFYRHFPVGVWSYVFLAANLTVIYALIMYTKQVKSSSGQ